LWYLIDRSASKVCQDSTRSACQCVQRAYGSLGNRAPHPAANACDGWGNEHPFRCCVSVCWTRSAPYGHNPTPQRRGQSEASGDHTWIHHTGPVVAARCVDSRAAGSRCSVQPGHSMAALESITNDHRIAHRRAYVEPAIGCGRPALYHDR